MRREDGMTVVEVIVAGLILVAGGLGVLGIVDAASRNTFRAEQSQVVANLLQGEMERLRQVPYEELALASLPVHVSDPENPNSRVSSKTFFYTGRNGTGLKQLVYKGGTVNGETIEDGTVAAGPTPFQVGGIKGDIYRYLVWDTCPSSLCQDGRYLKRAIVVAWLDETGSGGARRYQEIQGQFVDPEVEPAEFPSQEPGGTDTVPWRLFLTDTPCSQEARIPLPSSNGDHPTRNTRSDCGDGPQEGSVPGAPDLMWPDPPPDEEGEGEPGEKTDFKYDFATDVELSGFTDEGLQLMPGLDCDSPAATELATGVATDPDPNPDAFQKVHRWLSQPLTGGSEDLLLTGEGTLELWTQTMGGTPYKGRICAWLFVRSGSGATVVDKLAVNLGPPLSSHFERFEQSWPSDVWTEISLPLNFGYADEGGALPMPPGSRLGLALSVGDDSEDALQLRYDTPSFDSRLEVATTGAPPPAP
jgi:hypothetical protein